MHGALPTGWLHSQGKRRYLVSEALSFDASSVNSGTRSDTATGDKNTGLIVGIPAACAFKHPALPSVARHGSISLGSDRPGARPCAPTGVCDPYLLRREASKLTMLPLAG